MVKRRRVEKEKAIAYSRSKLFPWNFIFEDVEPAAIEHFVPYAVQVLGDLSIGGEKLSASAAAEANEAAAKTALAREGGRDAWWKHGGSSGGGSSVSGTGGVFASSRSIERREERAAGESEVEKERLRERIREEVRLLVSDFLSDADDEDALRMHGEFAALFPFAFSQCLVQAMLHKLNLRLEDVIDVRAISDLMGVSVRDIRKREDFIRNLLAHKQNMRFLAANILGRKVMSAEGERIGSVADIIFDTETGILRGIVVKLSERGVRVARERGEAVGSSAAAETKTHANSHFAENREEERQEGGEWEEKRRGLAYFPMQALRFNSYNGGFVLRSRVL